MKATKQATNAIGTQLSLSTAKAITVWSSQSVKEGRTKTVMIDGLHADAVTAEMLVAPKKDEPRALYDAVQKLIVAGFAVSVQSLLAKDVKTLNETQKTDRRYWQQQIGSKMKDIRNALTRRAQSGESDGASNAASWESTKRKVLSEIISQAQKKTGTKIKDLPAFIKDLQSALARIPADA